MQFEIDDSGDPQGHEFAAVFRAALRRRGMTLEEVRDQLAARRSPISTASLSYWANGRALPSTARALEVVRAMEGVLGLPAGQLVATLPSDAVSKWDSVVMAPFTERVRLTLDAMGLWPIDGCHAVFTYDSVDVRPGGRGQVETTRQVLQCDLDGTDRFPLVHEIGEEAVPLVVAGTGCRLGRVVAMPSESLFVAELLLSRPLAAGELTWVDYNVEWDVPVPGPVGLTRVLARTVSALVLDGTTPAVGDGPFYATAPYGMEVDTGPSTSRQALPPNTYQQVALDNPAPGTHVLALVAP